jgi:hypothetical protein
MVSTMTRAVIRLCFGVCITFFTVAVQADEQAIPEPFRGETPGSPIAITYADWSAILHATVFDAGLSDRTSAPSVRAETGTRRLRGNTSNTRLEGNRLVFPAFADEKNRAVLKAIRRELEAVPGEVPMREWTRNEQLAYWLNLYNITVIGLLADEYPVRSLKKLKYGSKNHPGLWDQKVLRVAGVPLSLNDIHAILMEKWNTTLVMYGLFQGYVGGPSIQTTAFTGATVKEQLIESARE